MSFATELEKYVDRLTITGALAAFEAAGDTIVRRTLEQWRAGRVPRVMIQRGALAILEDAWQAKRAEARKPR